MRRYKGCGGAILAVVLICLVFSIVHYNRRPERICQGMHHTNTLWNVPTCFVERQHHQDRANPSLHHVKKLVSDANSQNSTARVTYDDGKHPTRISPTEVFLKQGYTEHRPAVGVCMDVSEEAMLRRYRP